MLGLSDVVISGVPVNGYRIATEDVKEGVISINFSSFKNFEESILTKSSIFVPSVGKMTVAMLQRNLLRLFSQQTNTSIDI